MFFILHPRDIVCCSHTLGKLLCGGQKREQGKGQKRAPRWMPFLVSIETPELQDFDVCCFDVGKECIQSLVGQRVVYH